MPAAAGGPTAQDRRPLRVSAEHRCGQGVAHPPGGPEARGRGVPAGHAAPTFHMRPQPIALTLTLSPSTRAGAHAGHAGLPYKVRPQGDHGRRRRARAAAGGAQPAAQARGDRGGGLRLDRGVVRARRLHAPLHRRGGARLPAPQHALRARRRDGGPQRPDGLRGLRARQARAVHGDAAVGGRAAQLEAGAGRRVGGAAELGRPDPERPVQRGARARRAWPHGWLLRAQGKVPFGSHGAAPGRLAHAASNPGPSPNRDPDPNPT